MEQKLGMRLIQILKVGRMEKQEMAHTCRQAEYS